MALVACLSERLGYCQAGTRARLHALLRALHLPLTCTHIAPQGLLAAMAHDKKALNGVVRFVLLKDIGTVAFHQEVPLAALQDVLQQQDAA
jgi:3-dehydroquinate synthase